MRIVETVERECCAVKDMKPYKGGFTGGRSFPLNPQFCVHCGQIHIDEASIQIHREEIDSIDDLLDGMD